MKTNLQSLGAVPEDRQVVKLHQLYWMQSGGSMLSFNCCSAISSLIIGVIAAKCFGAVSEPNRCSAINFTPDITFSNYQGFFDCIPVS